MDVFDVRERLIDDYRSFTTAFVDIYDPRIKQYVEDQLANPDLSLLGWAAIGSGWGRSRR